MGRWKASRPCGSISTRNAGGSRAQTPANVSRHRAPAIRPAHRRPALAEIEALTNPRIREEWSARRKVRLEDVGAAPPIVMASFVYSGPSRFTDGSFGVYYAGFERETAIAESRFHTERFLSHSRMPATNVFKRMLHANAGGDYDDIREIPADDPIYAPDPSAYAGAQRYGLSVYVRNREDGIVYRSVRRNGGTCIAVFRPRLITKCTAAEMLMYAYDGTRIDTVMQVETQSSV
jgi:RES domain